MAAIEFAFAIAHGADFTVVLRRTLAQRALHLAIVSGVDHARIATIHPCIATAGRTGVAAERSVSLAERTIDLLIFPQVDPIDELLLDLPVAAANRAVRPFVTACAFAQGTGYEAEGRD